jgi:hypothetical protein
VNPYNNPYITQDGHNVPDYGPIEHIFLDVDLRKWFLGLLAQAKLDIDFYARYHLKLEVKNSSGTLKGRCPWCGGEESFSLDKKSLLSSCSICSKADDLLGLIGHKGKLKDLSLAFVSLKSFMSYPPAKLRYNQKVWTE